MNSIVQNLNYLGFAPTGTWLSSVEDEIAWEKTNHSAATTEVTFHKSMCDLNSGHTKMISRDLIVIE